jgi:hypothetical protein
MGNGGWCTIQRLEQELHSDHSVFVYGGFLSQQNPALCDCSSVTLLWVFFLGVIKSTVLVRLFMSY